jgi:hypothetical protein
MQVIKATRPHRKSAGSGFDFEDLGSPRTSYCGTPLNSK